MKILNFIPFLGKKKEKNANMSVSYYLMNQDSIISTKYDDPKYAIEGYIKNIIVYRAITLISDQIKRMKYRLYSTNSKGEIISEIFNHPLLTLLQAPYPNMNKTAFINRIMTQKLIYGNYYIEKVYKDRTGLYNNTIPLALRALRPDWITITEGNNGLNAAYGYNPDRGEHIRFQVTVIGKSNILHGMLINPDDDHHGLSPLVPASYSIDTHNAAGKWSYNFLKNGARPSGVLEVPAGIELHDTTFERLKKEIQDKFTGPAKAGKPLVLEGGMTWRQISTNSKDAEFIEMKKQATHEIALAFGIPIEMLNTEQTKYDNLNAAYDQLYHDQVLPLAEEFIDDLNLELVPLYGSNLLLEGDFSHTKVMQTAKLRLMEKINSINYITNNEKRNMTSFEPLDGEDEIPKKQQQITPEMNEYIANEMKDGQSYQEAKKIAQIIYDN